MMTLIRRAAEREKNRIDVLYRRCGYSGNVEPGDIALVAEVEGELVGTVRICKETGFSVLRGMRVLPAYQRMGIGSMLLRRCEELLPNGPCFCLPYAHLVPFYGQIGFASVAVHEIPPLLQSRLTTHRENGLDILSMRRDPRSKLALERVSTSPINRRADPHERR